MHVQLLPHLQPSPMEHKQTRYSFVAVLHDLWNKCRHVLTKSVNLNMSDGPTAPAGFFFFHGGAHYIYVKCSYFVTTRAEQDSNIAVN